MKTNRERANELLDRYSADFVNAKPLFRYIATALDKTERRWARKAAAVFAENTALKAEIACLKYGTQPEPQRYTREEARKLAAELRGTVEVYGGHAGSANYNAMLLALNAVIDAITGQPKPAPQFNADEVQRLIVKYGKLHTACANTKCFVVDDCGEMQATYYKLLAALGIE